MIETGSYRNDITSLSALDIRSYERIFKVFKASLEDKEFYVYNTLNKIDFPELGEEFIAYYTPPHRMAWTTLSYQLYEDIKSWWILYLLNKDKFTGASFYVDGGTQIKYIRDEYRALIYSDITNSTTFGGRHY